MDDEWEAAASHILITHAESEHPAPGVTRTRAEAEDLARRIALQARTRRAGFAELARKYSEDPRAELSGGYLGTFGRGDMVIEFDVAVFHMRVGQIRVVETPFGWHVVKRHPIQRVHAFHILIAWREAANVHGGVTRTKAAARNLAEEVRGLAAADGADLCALARRWSDDPNNSTICGDLGLIERGFLVPVFEDALFKLRPGQISAVVESDYGFHIIWRED